MNTWNQISAGGDQTCARRSDNTIWCWGNNDYGQLGNADAGTDYDLPDQEDSASVWNYVGTGWWHSCGIKTTGTLWCWGRDNRGQLGTGGGGDADVPQQESTTSTLWTTVSGGQEHTCATQSNGTLWCWGRNNNGQLGFGGGNVGDPTQVGALTNWASVTAGAYHTCGRHTDNTISCWGDNNNYGQVGDGSYLDRTTPVVIGGAEWASVDGGNGYFTCGIKTAGTLFCWGRNNFGQLGDNSLMRVTPSQVLKP